MSLWWQIERWLLSIPVLWRLVVLCSRIYAELGFGHGKWHHIAMTLGVGSISYYVDGELTTESRVHEVLHGGENEPA